MSYLPGEEWATQTPALSGFDDRALSVALMAAREIEIKIGADLSEMLPDGSRHPNDRPLGPLKSRGSPSGVVIRHGYLVGQYGDVVRPEVTFSVSKSYISALAGIALRDGLIMDVDEPVSKSVTDGGFDSEHNRQITWRHLLQQTSEWECELFGLPDWIDRGRQVSGPAAGREQTVGGSASESGEQYRSLAAPGTFWEYNDVRVNRTALALLRLFREPLPAVLRREVMNPISATDSWTWHGYLWWLNVDDSISEVADSTAFAARGAGGNIIFVWPSADMVIVLRWCADPSMVIDKILASLNS